MYSHVHHSIIHNGQDNKAAKMSTDGQMEKENVVYTRKGVLFIFKKEETPAICYTIDEPRGHYAKWKKPDTEIQIHDTTCVRHLQ